jgi:hypothetical protein
MTFTLQSFKSDTLAADMTDSATSMTLTTGAFGTPTGEQMLVIDYDIANKREVVKCTIDGTAVTSIDRAQDGTSAVAHSSGAKVIMAFVPSHYAALVDGTGINDNAISATKIKAEGLTAHSATLVGFSGTPTQNNHYIDIGKITILQVTISGDSNATNFTFTLPHNAKYANAICGFFGQNNGAQLANGARVDIAAGSNVATVYSTPAAGAWTNTGVKQLYGMLIYEHE